MDRRRGRGRKGGPLEGCDGVLSRALAGVHLRDLMVTLHIQNNWTQAVGPAFANNARPHAYSNGVLTVATKHASWQSELHFLRRPLLEKINAALPRPYVKELRFVARAAAPAAAAAEPAFAPPTPNSRHRACAQAIANQIDDEAVRATVARVVARALARDAYKPDH